MFQCILYCYRKQAYFVDLFVRVSNKVAIKMYQQLGYIVYRTVLEYYTGNPDEDAFGIRIIVTFINNCLNINWIFCSFLLSDMRKALSRDVKKKSVIPLTHPVRPEEIDWIYIMIMYIAKDLIQNKW